MVDSENRVRVAVDVMGGDYGPGDMVSGAIMAVEKGGWRRP
jgi:fatty acid/phospholipid biosynthesis enzyme